MPHPGSRLPKSETTRQKLLDVAVVEIVEAGPDKVGFTAIAKRASMSTGALYARYENADELLIEVWNERAFPALEKLSEAVVEACIGDDRRSGRQYLSTVVNSCDPEVAAGILILVAARRNEVLNEVIRPTFVAHVEEIADRLPVIEILLANVYGEILLSRGLALRDIDWSGVVLMLCRAASDALANPIDVSIVDVAFPTLEFADLDEFDSALFAAVADVIGRVGVENATISRIARKAAVNPASMYMRYADKDELLKRAVEVVMDAVSSANDFISGEFDDTDSTLSKSVSLWRARGSEEYAPIRNLRLELMAASGHHDNLQKVLIEKYAETEKSDAEAYGKISPAMATVVRPFVLYGRALFFGQAILVSYGFGKVDRKYFPTFVHNMLVTIADAQSRVVS